MRNKQILKILPVAVAIAMVIVVSCSKKDDTEPEVPPIETFQMTMEDDLNNEETSPDTASGTVDTTIYTDTTAINWIHSGANVFVWNVVIAVNMVVPVAAYAESFNHDPEWVRKEKRWKWEYDVTVGGIVYTAELYGKVDGDYIDWEMYLSKQNDWQQFLWYEGRSRIDKTSGEWTLYRYPNNPQKYIQIDWNRNSSGTAADVKYTNVVPNGAENGGYIHYGKTTDTDFDRYYKIYNKGKDNLTDIKWNSTSKEGRVMDPNKFGDSDWHCWNKYLFDTDC